MNKFILISLIYGLSIVIVDSGLPYVDGLRRLTSPSFYIEVILFPVKVQIAIIYEWWWYLTIMLLHILLSLSLVICIVAFVRDYVRVGRIDFMGQAVACGVLMINVLILFMYGLIVVLYVLFIYPYEACVQALRMLKENE